MPREASFCEGREGLPLQIKSKFETMLDVQRILAGTVNPDGSLKPAGWRALLQAVEMDMTIMADALGVSPSTVSQVIAGKKHSRMVEDTLAELFHLDPMRVWGRK